MMNVDNNTMYAFTTGFFIGCSVVMLIEIFFMERRRRRNLQESMIKEQIRQELRTREVESVRRGTTLA